jgi:hypothetical protein
MESLMDEIDRLEKEKQALEHYFASRRIDPTDLETKTLRHREIEALIESRTLRWEELAERV